MDAITMLKQDHKRVRDLFKKYEAAGDTAYKTKGRLVEEMIRELSIHADVEEEVFYPATREWVEQADDDVLEALEEHHIVKWTPPHEGRRGRHVSDGAQGDAPRRARGARGPDGEGSLLLVWAPASADAGPAARQHRRRADREGR
jgi:hypothetical protein